MPHYRCPGCGTVNVGDKPTKCVGKACKGVMLVECDDAALSAYHERNIRLVELQAALGDMIQRHHHSECMHCNGSTPCRRCVSQHHECHTAAYLRLLEPMT